MNITNKRWYLDIVEKVNKRQQEIKEIQPIYRDFEILCSNLARETQAKKKLENEIIFMKTLHETTGSKFDLSNRDNTNIEMKANIISLKEERNSLYKNQILTSQKIQELKDSKINLEKENRNFKSDILELNKTIKSLSIKLSNTIEISKEKDNTLELIQGELTTYHLELLKTDEKIKILKEENTELTNRWVEKKNKEADSLNTENSIYIKEKFNTMKMSSHSSSSRVSLSDIKFKDTPSIKPQFVDINIPVNKRFNFTSHIDQITAIKFATDSSMLATGSVDSEIHVVQTLNKKRILTLKGATKSVMSICFDHANKLVLAASNDNCLRLWDLSTARVKDTFTGHIGKVYATKFAPDSKRAISGSHDRTLKLWEINKNICVRTIYCFSSCNDVCWLGNDGNNIASAHMDNSVKLWDMRSGNSIKELSDIHTGQVTGVYCTNDRFRLFSSSRDNKIVSVDLRTFNVLNVYDAPDFRIPLNWSKIAISPNDKYIAAGSVNGCLYFWDVDSGKLVKELEAHDHATISVDWASNNVLASFDKEKNVVLWDDQ